MHSKRNRIGYTRVYNNKIDMRTIRPIQRILWPRRYCNYGFNARRFFPGRLDVDEYRMSPFFSLDYNAKMDFPPTEKPCGMEAHPHRGLEAVTIVYHGKVAYQDNFGNRGVIEDGDVQWMTAAAGILHEEYQDTEYTKKGGPFQMVQLWVNLPAKDKMTKPHYQTVTSAQTAKYPLSRNRGLIEVIAGTFRGVKGTVRTFTPIEMYNIKLNKGARLGVFLPPEYNTGLLIVEGSVKINGKDTVEANNFVLFRNEGDKINLKAQENSVSLLLSGEPIKEPISAFGPFLMNTREEILQAYKNFFSGKFGRLKKRSVK